MAYRRVSQRGLSIYSTHATHRLSDLLTANRSSRAAKKLCLCSKGKVEMRKIPLYSHWMSNFQPSSSASEGDIWLYALHDKYFPASERLSVIDNVLVVWFPSLDVCGKSKREILFFSIFFFTSIRSTWTPHSLINQKKIPSHFHMLIIFLSSIYNAYKAHMCGKQ